MVLSPSDVRPADPLLLRQVRVVGAGPQPVDVRLAGGLVTDIGKLSPTGHEEVLHWPDTTLLPGFVDGHVHSNQWASSRRHIDVSNAGSPHQVAEMLRGTAMARHGDDMILAHGFRDALWDARPHKDLLESALPGAAVAIVSQDLHAMWMSPRGLDKIGWEHATGVLREQECMSARRAIAEQESTSVVDQWVVDATYALAARGVTEIIDFEFADNRSDWLRRTAAYEIRTRVRTSVWRPWLDEAIEDGLTTGQPLPHSDGLLEVGPFKLIVDGSLNNRTAYCYDPYPEVAEPDERHGLLLIPELELVKLMTKAVTHGLQPAVHAIGDRANALVLNAFEHVGCPGRIEHAQLVRPQDAHRFARPGLVTSVQPQHAMDDRDVADHHWSGRTAWAFPYAQLHAAGARLELGSDAPVADPDPRQAIADAVWRTKDNRPPWHVEQAIPLSVALAAASGGRDRIRVGDRADLVVVGCNPTHLDHAGLRQMPVLMTLVAGRPTFRASD